MSEQSPFPPFLPSASTPSIQPEEQVKKPARKPRKPRVPAVEKIPAKEAPTRSLKFDLQTILAAAADLNADDYPLFEKVVGLLDEAGKPGRERLLAAIRKVFP